ncbi:MAG TPA: S24 family peptidase [Chloroflexota bacterium]|nr:S24 family peptidase [Chloroflexota bacterium]
MEYEYEATSAGLRVSQLREKAGLTQLQLGLAAGVSRGYVVAFERGGRQRARLPTLNALAQALGWDDWEHLRTSDADEPPTEDESGNGNAGDMEQVARRVFHEQLRYLPIAEVLGGARIPLVAFTSAGLGGGGPVAGWEYVASEQMTGAQLRAAQVVGGCMAPEIEEGDIVLFDAKRREPRDGQLIVATLLDTDEAVLKRFYREGAMVRLQPMKGEPIMVRGNRLLIEGVVVEVRRRYPV